MRFYLAPMEGVIDYPLRQLYRQIGGLDVFVTEFVRVTDHVLPRKVFLRYCPELHQSHCDTRVQLLGSNAEALAQNAAKAAQLGAAAIDLNFGCPAKTVNRHRGGACLLNEPDTVAKIVAKVREAVPLDTPVTAKIRLGYEKRDNYVTIARAICAAGANELVVHARSKTDGYRPPAYWSCIAEIRSAVHIPVIANGEIWSVEDYLNCLAQSGCEDVMLGRGVLAHPDLALAIRAHINQQSYQPLSWPSILNILYDFYEQTRHHYPKKYQGNRLKQWLVYLKRHYPAAELFFQELKYHRDSASIEACFERAFTHDCAA